MTRKGMGASLRETGSHEPSPSSTGLGPAGFDPAREGDTIELLEGAMSSDLSRRSVLSRLNPRMSLTYSSGLLQINGLLETRDELDALTEVLAAMRQFLRGAA